jgi:hypothetical protein
MGHAPDYTPVYQSMADRKPNTKLRNACFAAMAIGVIAIAYGLFVPGTEVSFGAHENPLRVKGAFIQNFMYFNGIAQGGLMMTVIGVTTYARWTRRFKRIHEALAWFLPVSYALLLIFLALGGIEVFPWHHQGPEGLHAAGAHHKAMYFDTTFFWARQILGLGLMGFLSIWFVNIGRRADLGVAKGAMEKMGLKAPEAWDKEIQNWEGDEIEIEKAQSKMINIAPAISIGYATIYSIVAVDLSMSLAPYFFANMYPAWYFMSCIWSGLIWTAIFTISTSKTLGLDNLMQRNFYHDLGKLTFAFTMFWGYTTFAHYLPIWYGNMTEEIGFILYRTHGEVFGQMTLVTLTLCFGAPFVIFLSRGLKKQPKKYLVAACLTAFGIWLERYIVNAPSIHSYWMVNEDGSPITGLPFGFIEVGMGIGFLGLFVLVVTNYLSKYPGAVVGDPYMNPDPREVHVHAHH